MALAPPKLSVRTIPMKSGLIRKKSKNFKELQRRNRWSQQEIAFRCPIAPLKNAILCTAESNYNIQIFCNKNNSAFFRIQTSLVI